MPFSGAVVVLALVGFAVHRIYRNPTPMVKIQFEKSIFHQKPGEGVEIRRDSNARLLVQEMQWMADNGQDESSLQSESPCTSSEHVYQSVCLV